MPRERITIVSWLFNRVRTAASAILIVSIRERLSSRAIPAGSWNYHVLNSWYFIGYLLTKSKDHLSKSAEFNFRDDQPIVVVAVVILKLDRLCCLWWKFLISCFALFCLCYKLCLLLQKQEGSARFQAFLLIERLVLIAWLQRRRNRRKLSPRKQIWTLYALTWRRTETTPHSRSKRTARLWIRRHHQQSWFQEGRIFPQARVVPTQVLL